MKVTPNSVAVTGAIGFLAISFIANGCAKGPEGTMQSLPAEIRSWVLAEATLDQMERHHVQTHSPDKVGAYKIAGSYGQYVFSWLMPTGRSVTVNYEGDIENIDIERLRLLVNGHSPTTRDFPKKVGIVE